VPLLHHAAGARASGEGGEAPRVHAGGIGRQHTPGTEAVKNPFIFIPNL